MERSSVEVLGHVGRNRRPQTLFHITVAASSVVVVSPGPGIAVLVERKGVIIPSGNFMEGNAVGQLRVLERKLSAHEPRGEMSWWMG